MVTLTPKQLADLWWDQEGLRTYVKGASHEDYMKLAFISGYMKGEADTKYLYTDESTDPKA